MEPETQVLPPASEPAQDVIVIPRWILIAVGAALAGLIIGGALGFFIGQNAAKATARAEVLAELAANGGSAAGAAGAAAPAPTEPPSRLDNVSVDDDPGLGPEDAAIVIVEFSDFRCPFCQRWENDTRTQILETYGQDVRIVFRDFPVVGGQRAAEAGECADEQGEFWNYHEALFADPQAYNANEDFVALAEELGLNTTTFSDCLESGKYRNEVLADYNDGVAYGVSGTPTFFINGVRLVGAQPFSAFAAVIDEELAGR